MGEIYKGPIEEVKLVEKVKLTREQVNAMKVFLEDNGNDKEHLVDWFVANRDFRHSVDIEYRALADLKTSTLSKALYIGYEIKNNYKKGDKVLFQVGDSVPMVVTLQEHHPNRQGEWRTYQGCGYISEGQFRQATEQEKYWIGELGREKVGDFKEGDIVITDLNVPIKAGEYDVPGRLIGPERLMKFYKNKSLKGIYPAESFKPFPGDSK